MVEDKNIKQAVILGIVAIIFILAFLILKPILISIIFGLLLAYIFSPVYKIINSKIKRKTISASLLIIGIIVIIALPLIWLTPIVVRQTFDLYTSLQQINLAEPIASIMPSVFSEETSRGIAIHLNNLIGKTFSSFLNGFTEFLVDIPNLLLQFAVFGFTFFFSVRDSDKLRKYIFDLSPFSEATENKFMREFRGITNSIIYGQVLIGVLQGLALGAGLWILGIPKALMLTAVATIVSIIPFLGSWFVWLPTGIFLIVSGNTFSGFAIILYGALFVATIDNVLRTIFISRSSNLPIVMSFIGVIGGLYFLGLAGLVLGPLILAYAMIIIELYKQGKLEELFKK